MDKKNVLKDELRIEMRDELLEKVNGGASEYISITPFHVTMTSGMYKGLGGTAHTEITGTDYKIYLVRLDDPSKNKEPGGADPMIFEDEFIVG